MGHLLKNALIAFVLATVLYGMLVFVLAAGSTEEDFRGGTYVEN